MRISTDARTTDIQPAINWIGGLMGGALDKRVAAFEQQERSNPLLADQLYGFLIPAQRIHAALPASAKAHSQTLRP